AVHPEGRPGPTGPDDGRPGRRPRPFRHGRGVRLAHLTPRLPHAPASERPRAALTTAIPGRRSLDRHRVEGVVNLTKIYTRTGDDGTTGLGDFSRTRKTDPRLIAFADVNEANAAIGVAVAAERAGSGGGDL